MGWAAWVPREGWRGMGAQWVVEGHGSTRRGGVAWEHREGGGA